jgi:hypothetical protein
MNSLNIDHLQSIGDAMDNCERANGFVLTALVVRTHLTTKNDRSISLPTGFTDGEDELRLADSINGGLRILKDNGYIYQYLRHQYGQQLGDKAVWEDQLHLS